MTARPVPSAAALIAALSVAVTFLALAIGPADAAAKSRMNAEFSAPSRSAKARIALGGQRSTARRSPAASDAGKAPLFGVHTVRDPYFGDTDNTDALEQRLDRRIDIVHWFQNWAGDDWIPWMHTEVFSAVTDGDRLPLLTWMPADGAQVDQNQSDFRLEAITDGRYDDYIARTARDLKAIGGPIYLRLMHEMNGNWSPWGATISNNTPARYVAAWRHIHDIFAAEGATNVKWVWCPMAESTPDTRANRLENYYPGDRYVDILSLDGYNWGSTRPDMGGWRSFKKIFREPVNRLSALGDQPIWLAEVGSAPEGGDKAKWIREMWKVAARWKQIEAIVWFDQDKERNWTSTSSEAVAAAFGR